MSNLKKKLDALKKDEIKKRWERIDSGDGLSTREKLEKLVKLSIKREERKTGPTRGIEEEIPEPSEEGAFITREFSYPPGSSLGTLTLDRWEEVTSRQLALFAGDEEFLDVSPGELLFFDTETTGLSGGTGTIPFLLGFGFFEECHFKVKIFILTDLYREEEMLDEVNRFLGEKNFSATVTYNGKGFDFPLMETRYILCRKRFSLLSLPHLDFLYPARTLWKNTYESRRLSYLGDVLLGISRAEDVDGSMIPALYFNYLRSRSFSLIEKVVEHNALDLLGLAGLVLLAARYLEDFSRTRDEGEMLGTALLFERSGELEKAGSLYREIKESASRQEIVSMAVKRLAILMKKDKLYDEAAQLWEQLIEARDKSASRELSMHFEHREKDYVKALEFVKKGLESSGLTGRQREDFEKRLQRLNKKLQALDRAEEG